MRELPIFERTEGIKIAYAVFENLLLTFNNWFQPENNKVASSPFRVEVLEFCSRDKKVNSVQKIFHWFEKKEMLIFAQKAFWPKLKKPGKSLSIQQ